MIEIWRRKIPRNDKVLTGSDWVCAEHFSSDDILTHWEHIGPNGQKIRIERERPILKKGAIPCIFPPSTGTPKYLSCDKKRRKPPTERGSPIVKKKTRKCTEGSQNCDDNQPETDCENTPNSAETHSENKLTSNTRKRKPAADTPILEKKYKVYSERSAQWVDDNEIIPGANPKVTSDETGAVDSPEEEAPQNEGNQTYDIFTDSKNVKRPSSFWGHHFCKERKITFFSHLNEYRKVDKVVEFQSDTTVKLYLRDAEVAYQTEQIKGRQDVENILEKIHQMKLCIGASPSKFARNCTKYCELQKTTRGPKSQRCTSCRLLREAEIKKHKRAIEREKKRPKMTRIAKLGQQKRRLLRKVIQRLINFVEFQ